MPKPQARPKPQSVDETIDLSPYRHTLWDQNFARVHKFHSRYDPKPHPNTGKPPSLISQASATSISEAISSNDQEIYSGETSTAQSLAEPRWGKKGDKGKSTNNLDEENNSSGEEFDDQDNESEEDESEEDESEEEESEEEESEDEDESEDESEDEEGEDDDDDADWTRPPDASDFAQLSDSYNFDDTPGFEDSDEEIDEELSGDNPFESSGLPDDIEETAHSLISILFMSENYQVILDQLKNYRDTNPSDLSKELRSAVAWRARNILQRRLHTLEDKVAPIRHHPFKVVGGRPMAYYSVPGWSMLNIIMTDLSSGLYSTQDLTKLVTFLDMFRQAYESLSHLLSTLRINETDEEFNEVLNSIPVRAPETILIAIELQSRYAPTEDNLEKLDYPEKALNIKLTPEIKDDGARLTKFDTQKSKEPWSGAPAMHHVTVCEKLNRWFVGSTASRVHHLEGAQELLKGNREVEIGEYTHLMALANRWAAEKDKMYTKDERRGLIKLFKETQLGKKLDMSGYLGVAIRQNLTIALNCFRCEVFFSWRQVGESSFSDAQRAENTKAHKFKVDGTGKEPHSCAEVITSLQLIEAMNRARAS
ncbi:hypothetical protein DM02DRAFT_631237 [Periconia macrospinosa]|uniref:Uncharacterized protein n=1 Tax=Periconia macrospinosa TaxID=97972 RepID=A0A2V1DGP7_9PLEO|nr:hypothetical protein DM02DRAFT_631237 [Periconia macrospinosa]